MVDRDDDSAEISTERSGRRSLSGARDHESVWRVAERVGRYIPAAAVRPAGVRLRARSLFRIDAPPSAGEGGDEMGKLR